MVLAVAELLQIERVQRLLELPLERHRQHGLAEIDRLAHEREAAAGEHRARRRQVAHEAVLAEALERHVAEDLVALEPVDEEAPGQPLQRGHEVVEGVRGLIDEHVVAVRARRVEHRVAQDRREQAGALFARRRKEEGGDEVVIAMRQLGLDDGLRHLPARLLLRRNLHVERAAIDDLHVVDAEHRQVVLLGVQVGERLEVADDELGAEALRQPRHRLEVLGERRQLLEKVERGAPPLHLVVLVDHVEPGDLVHLERRGTCLPQKGVRAPADDDLHVVLARRGAAG